MKDKKGISRRDMFKVSAAAGAAAMVGNPLLARAERAPDDLLAQQIETEKEALPQVPRRQLGKTGKTVPILLLGGSMQFDQRFDPKFAEAYRFGVDYIDAADCYAGGTCETAVGAFHTKLKNRDKIWITSKSDKHDPKGFEETLDQSLERMQTDYVDLYYLHALQDGSVLNKDLLATVERLKKEGKILHFGFSCHHGNVPELLDLAAKTPWVESIMFRYNFRKYDDAALNKAMDACVKSDIGLIAMKTQGSEASFADAWQKFEQTGKWNKHQSVLKAVWADERLSASVSHMDTLEKLKENIAAALDKEDLGQAEIKALEEYAQATRAYSCDGCDHICNPAVHGEVQIGATLRYLMYHDVYGEKSQARELFAKLPSEAQAIRETDFAPANRACPHGVDVAGLMDRASKVFRA